MEQDNKPFFEKHTRIKTLMNLMYVLALVDILIFDHFSEQKIPYLISYLIVCILFLNPKWPASVLDRMGVDVSPFHRRTAQKSVAKLLEEESQRGFSDSKEAEPITKLEDVTEW